jgi:hypothetical protein
MGNLGEELEDMEKEEGVVGPAVEEATAPTENFEQVQLTQEQLKEIFMQQDPDAWEAAQLKMRYLDALGRKRSGQKQGTATNTQARQVIHGNSRAARRMFKRKSGEA